MNKAQSEQSSDSENEELKHLEAAMTETREGHRGFDLAESTLHVRSLRHILTAYAYYSCPHPDPAKKIYFKSKYQVGYCQSLNFIAGMLLLVFSHDTEFETNPVVRKNIEERVFWTLAAMIDNILPVDMYGHSLEGAQLDQRILWNTFLKRDAEKFGILPFSQWLASVEDGTFVPKNKKKGAYQAGGVPPFETISTQWLLTCFLNALPVQVASLI